MRFYVPTDLRIAEHCVLQSEEALLSLGDSCLLVTGRTAAKKSGALADVCAVLDAQQIDYRVYDYIAQNPTVGSCREAGLMAADCGAQFIVGVGGGSALDAAKAVAVFAANPELTEPALYAYAWEKAPLPVVCVGTTAGTGSEVTPVSVLTNAAGRKQSIRDDRLYPALSLGDPRYLTSLPDDFTRSCAVDAAAHCIESYFSVNATEMSRLFALKGAAILAPLFHRIRADGVPSLTAAARAQLYLASIYGGYAISVTGTAFPHAMGYFLTEQYGVPHGIACAVYLPAYLLHSLSCDESSAKAFCRGTDCGIEEWIALIRAVTPACGVRMRNDEIEALRARFEHNSGLARSPGDVTADDALRMIRTLFAGED